MRWFQYAYVLGAVVFVAAAVLEVFVPLLRGTPLFPRLTGAGRREVEAQRALARQRQREVEAGVEREYWELKAKVDADRVRKSKKEGA